MLEIDRSSEALEIARPVDDPETTIPSGSGQHPAECRRDLSVAKVEMDNVPRF